MAYDIGLADRLRDELGPDRVVEIAGWQTRGRSVPNFKGFVWHHTAGAATGIAPSLNAVIYGFAGSAPGPLCNVFQDRQPDGQDKAYVIAAGTANHAGSGGWQGLTGNSSVIGLEVEHTGREPFPRHRQETAWRIAAACIRGLPHNTDARYACQHFEWSYPPGSKIDICCEIDPDDFRFQTTQILRGTRPGPMPDLSFLLNQEVVEMYAVCGPLVGQIGRQALVMAGSKCVAQFGGPDSFGIPLSFAAWRDRVGGKEALKVFNLDNSQQSAEIMANLRWPSVQTGAGLS